MREKPTAAQLKRKHDDITAKVNAIATTPKPQRKRLKRLQQEQDFTDKPPVYAVVIPCLVPDAPDDASESSCLEDEPAQAPFPPAYFDNPSAHFQLDAKQNSKTQGKIGLTSKKRGVVQKPLASSKQSCSAPLSSTQSLIQIFEDESFAQTTKESRAIASQRLGITLGFNRMHSVSSRNNKMLNKTFQAATPSLLTVNKLAFDWSPHWIEIDLNGEVVPVEFSRVRQFYKLLKGIDADKAKAFVQQTEVARRALQIPYREIRDTIKNAEATKNTVSSLRSKNPHSETYLATADDDTQSLRANQLGTYSIFDNMVREHKAKNGAKCEVAGVGYTLMAKRNTDQPIHPHLELALLLDQWTRHATASKVKNGVYYAEPAMIVRVLQHQDTVKENSSTGKLNYSTPNESTNLIDNIMSNRGLNPDNVMAYNAAGAIATGHASRFNIPTGPMHKRADGKLVRWTIKQMRSVKNLSQSHYGARQWAQQMLNAFTLYSKFDQTFNGKNINIKNKAALKNLAVSAISRLYNHYDALSMAIAAIKQANELTFQEALIKQLQNASNRNRALTQIRIERKRSSNAAINEAWQYLDRLDDIDKLKAFINRLIDHKDGNEITPADRIEGAAIAASQRAIQILRQRLCLDVHKLQQQMMQDTLQALAKGNNLACPEITLDSLLYRLIYDELLTPANTKLRKEAQTALEKANGAFDQNNLTLLHWAAFTGKEDCVRLLISPKIANKFPQHANKEAQAAFAITPLYCALKYYADFGGSTKTIEYLATPATVLAPAHNGLSPMVIALTECDNPYPIVDLLCSKGNIGPKLAAHIRLLAKTDAMNNDEHALIYYLLQEVPPSQQRFLFIDALLNAGVNPDVVPDFDKNVEYLYETSELDDTQSLSDSSEYEIVHELIPENHHGVLFMAIRDGDIALVALLIKAGITLTNCEDVFRYPPVLSAYLSLRNPLPMIKYLVDHGADINDFELSEETNILFECIGEVLCHNSFKRIRISQTIRDYFNTNPSLTPLLTKIDEAFAEQRPILDYVIEHESTRLDVTDGAGNTPMDCALEIRNDVLANQLLDAGLCVDLLSPEETRAIRELTGRKDVYCDRDYLNGVADSDSENSEDDYIELLFDSIEERLYRL